MLTDREQIVQQWKENPLKLHAAISTKTLWSKQIEILQAVRKYPRIAVRSGNTVGKTNIAAEIVLDWLFTNYPSKVVTTSASFAQVEDALWKEIGSLWSNSPIKFNGELQKVGLYFNEDHFAVGLSVDKPVRLQGRHSPNLLVLVDEASGIDPLIWDMFEALHPKTVVVLGNPLDATGKFAECFMSNRWHQITVSCEDCVAWQEKNGKIPGLVTREWIKDMADLHGVKSAWYRVHVLGLPPEQDEFALIERQWVDRARKGLDADGLPLDKEEEEHEIRIVGLDMATKHGSNESVLGYRYGHTIKTMKAYPKQTSTFIRDQVASVYNAQEANIAVSDADGVGESMADMLSEMHVPSLEFHGGSTQKAMDERKFRNIRTQFYKVIALKFEKGLYDLRQMNDKDFEILRSQLTSIRVKAPDGLGRMQIETKEDMLARQIKSPDWADCFMMMEYAYFMMRQGLETRPRAMGAL